LNQRTLSRADLQSAAFNHSATPPDGSNSMPLRGGSGGAKRDRTADLYNAIVALSQLSYGPNLWNTHVIGRCRLFVSRVVTAHRHLPCPTRRLRLRLPIRSYVDEAMERAKGFEPSTPTLARLCSTPELRPRISCGVSVVSMCVVSALGCRAFTFPALDRSHFDRMGRSFVPS
jgi:hypothetical protein